MIRYTLDPNRGGYKQIMFADFEHGEWLKYSDVEVFLSEIDRLQNENEQLKTSLKLVQSHAKTAIDKCSAKWNEGYHAGLKSAGMEYEKIHPIFQQLKKERADDNAAFTAEIMRLETALEQIINEGATSTRANEIAREALK